MTTDLFGTTQIEPETPQIDPTKDYHSELVGEGKKFQDVNALARGKVEADAFITRLQNELAGLRQELNTRIRLEEVVTQLQSPKPPVTPSNVDDTHLREPNREPQGLSAEALEELLNKALNERETKSAKKTNAEYVMQELSNSFGPSYVSVLKAKTAELGLTTEQVNAMAAEAPKALLALVGASGTRAPSTTPTPPRSTVSTTFTPQVTERNMAYWEAVRKSDPSRYWHKDTQNQIHKDALALGERFFT